MQAVVEEVLFRIANVILRVWHVNTFQAILSWSVGHGVEKAKKSSFSARLLAPLVHLTHAGTSYVNTFPLEPRRRAMLFAPSIKMELYCIVSACAMVMAT